MPNFDTGHYFLTTLAPIKHGSASDERGVEVSHIERLRTTLAILPTALQSPATEQIGINSPFARDRHTHLCRFMVLDDVVYNGRPRSDAIVNALTGKDPLVPQKVDRLNCAYLMFAADFDAVKEEGDPLPETLTPAEQDAVRDAYARRLWQTMNLELREIYDNCVGFNEVSDADGFARYLGRCQVETTMPFNDYWIRPPKLHGLPVTGLIALVAVPALVTLIGFLWWLFGAPNSRWSAGPARSGSWPPLSRPGSPIATLYGMAIGPCRRATMPICRRCSSRSTYSSTSRTLRSRARARIPRPCMRISAHSSRVTSRTTRWHPASVRA